MKDIRENLKNKKIFKSTNKLNISEKELKGIIQILNDAVKNGKKTLNELSLSMEKIKENRSNNKS